MFFNKNTANLRKPEVTESGLSPRFARLVRESWWLLVVALLLFLALILGTYSKTDAALVDVRHRRPPPPISAVPSARGSPTCCSTCSACPRGGG